MSCSTPAKIGKPCSEKRRKNDRLPHCHPDRLYVADAVRRTLCSTPARIAKHVWEKEEMTLLLTVVLIVCMLLALFAALPFPAAAPYAWGFPILIWISVAILIFNVTHALTW